MTEQRPRGGRRSRSGGTYDPAALRQAARQTEEGKTATSHILRLQQTIGNEAVVRSLDTSTGRIPIQRTVYGSMDEMWADVVPGMKLSKINKIVRGVPELVDAYSDIARHLNRLDFRYEGGRQPEVDVNPGEGGRYRVIYGTPNEQQRDFLKVPARFVAYILHEMMHVAAALQYNTNVAPRGNNVEHMVNMNVPEGIGELRPDSLAENQFEDIGAQNVTQAGNWEHLLHLSRDDRQLSKEQKEVVRSRANYAQDPSHNDTVLVDLLFYLASQAGKVKKSRTYRFAQLMLREANARRRSGHGKIAKLN